MKRKRKKNKKFNLKRLWIIIPSIILLIILIDYLCVLIFGTMPLFAITKENKKEQVIVHSALFYRVWECTAEENNYKIGSYRDRVPVCPKVIKFKDGYFTNWYGMKISSDEIILLMQYYGYDVINNWKTREKVSKALYIIDELESRIFSITKINGISIATFKEKINGKWEIPNDGTNRYCVKVSDDNRTFLFTEYNNDECGTEWSDKKQKYSGKLCEALKHDKEIRSYIGSLDELCD